MSARGTICLWVVASLLLPPLAGCQRERDARAEGAGTTLEKRPAAAACGRSGEPDCPLQAWMKATLQPHLTASAQPDTDRLAAALEKLATAAPAELPEWARMARDGAAQATAKNMAGVRESCARCHDAYRARFKAEMRNRKLL